MAGEVIFPRLPYPPDFVDDPQEQNRRLYRWLADTLNVYNALLNRGLRWQNLRSVLISHTFNATPDAVDTIVHNLGKVPEFFVWNVQSASPIPGAVPMVYYTSADKTAWTTGTIALRCNVASAPVTLLVM